MFSISRWSAWWRWRLSSSRVLANVPITRYRIPPFLVAWLVPLVVGLGIGYVHPVWQRISLRFPGRCTPEPLRAMRLALPYLSVIAPMAIYQVLQDIASVAGAAAAGDDYDPRGVLAWDGLGTLVCGLAGSVITPVVYAMHPPYKAIGARIGFALWTPVMFLAVVMSGLTIFVVAIISLADSRGYYRLCFGRRGNRHSARVDRKYLGVVLLGFVLPAGAVVATAMNSALPALQLSAANPAVQAALNRSIYWSSIQGLGNGFLFLVLVVASLIAETIDRRFGRAAIWCLCGRCILMAGIDAFGFDPLGFATGVRGGMAGRRRYRLFRPLVGG